MSPPRKFDHDECRALYKAGGWTQAALAARYGVTQTRVNQIVNLRVSARMAAYQADRQRSLCSECGQPCSFNRSRQEKPRCRACFGLSITTTVRADALKCLSCKEWKWDNEFPHSRHPSCDKRRGRHNCCRACSTALRREYREKRKVPCDVCGAPCLPPSEKGARAADRCLCIDCYRASVRRKPGAVTPEAASHTGWAEASVG